MPELDKKWGIFKGGRLVQGGFLYEQDALDALEARFSTDPSARVGEDDSPPGSDEPDEEEEELPPSPGFGRPSFGRPPPGRSPFGGASMPGRRPFNGPGGLRPPARPEPTERPPVDVPFDDDEPEEEEP